MSQNESKYWIEGQCEYTPEINQNSWYCSILNVSYNGTTYIYCHEDHEQGNESDLTYKIIEDAGLSAALLDQYPAGSIGANERLQRGENALVRGEDLLPEIVDMLAEELSLQEKKFDRREKLSGEILAEMGKTAERFDDLDWEIYNAKMSAQKWGPMGMLSVNQAADLAGKSTETIKKACQSGALAAIKFGRAWEMKPSDVDAWLGKLAKPTTTSPPCPHCTSTRTIKRGVVHEIQRYMCKSCGKTFNDPCQES